ncbi:MAG: hypothetical protein J4F28_07820, partial [Nitrosopumilaceae archaeon]|nr:hypothetical protein [Nitrosopumilaceae archaeon]
TKHAARHAVCCPIVSGMPMTTTPDAMLDALRLVREDYARRLAESNNNNNGGSGAAPASNPDVPELPVHPIDG